MDIRVMIVPGLYGFDVVVEQPNGIGLRVANIHIREPTSFFNDENISKILRDAIEKQFLSETVSKELP